MPSSGVVASLDVGQVSRFAPCVRDPFSPTLPEQVRLNKVYIPLCNPSDDVFHFVHNLHPIPLSQDFPIIARHRHADYALEVTPKGRLSDALEVFVFTDGSLPNGDRADFGPAFAFIALGVDARGCIFYIGHLVAQLRDVGFPDFDSVSSTHTELAAIIFALLWAASVKLAVPWHVSSDSLISVNAINLHNAPGAYFDLCNVAFGLLDSIGHFHLAAVQMPSFGHVKGHSGVPWNEAVDTLAHHAAIREIPCSSYVPSVAILCSGHVNHGWALVARGLFQPHAYPDVHNGSFVVVPPSASADHVCSVNSTSTCESGVGHPSSSHANGFAIDPCAPGSAMPCVNATDHRSNANQLHRSSNGDHGIAVTDESVASDLGNSDQRVIHEPNQRSFTSDCVDVVLGTHNVLSLQDPSVPDEHIEFSRVAMLLQIQYSKLGVSVVGIQEARRHSFSRSSDLYHMISSGDAHGQLGCELWFASTIPYLRVGSREYFFKPSHLHTIYYNPRVLVVDCHAPKFRSRFICVHAPTSLFPEERVKFFADIGRFFNCAKSSFPCFLMGDLNGRFHLSPGCSRDVVDASMLTRTFFSDYSLIPTVGVQAFAESASKTWAPSSGCDPVHTIDYIALPANFIDCLLDSHTIHDIDNGHCVTDHVLVVAHLRVPTRHQAIERNPQVPRILRSQLEDPEAVSCFRKELSKIHSPAFSTCLEQHYQFLVDSIARAMRRAFKKPPAVPKMPYASTELLGIVATRKALRSEIRLVSRSIKRIDSMFDPSSHAALRDYLVNYKRALGDVLKQLRKLLVARSRYDYSMYVYKVGSDISATSLACNPAASFSCLKYLMTLGAKCKYSNTHNINIMYDLDGTAVSGSREKAHALLKHFANTELADLCDKSSLVDKHCLEFSPPPQSLSSDNIMSVTDFRSRILGSNRSTAPGVDGVNPLLAHVDPVNFTRLYHPLHVKMSVTLHEPISLKGSIACPVKKKGMSTCTPLDVRSVLLKNYVVKHHHAFLRTRLYALVHSSLHVSQCGGIKGRGTDMATALIRWCSLAFAHYKLSYVTFYVDIKSAFYSMIRQLVMPMLNIEGDIADIVDRIGVPDAFVEPLKLLIAQPSLIEQFISDKHLAGLITSSQCANWFALAGSLTVSPLPRLVAGQATL